MGFQTPHTYGLGYKIDENGKCLPPENPEGLRIEGSYGFSPAFTQFGQQCLNVLVNGRHNWRKYSDTRPAPPLKGSNHIGLRPLGDEGNPEGNYEVTRKRRKYSLEDS